MIKSTLKQELTNRGWKEDRYGHHQKELRLVNRETREEKLRVYRVKLQATSVRVEVKSELGWVRVDGAYLKDIEITETGAIQIGRKLLK